MIRNAEATATHEAVISVIGYRSQMKEIENLNEGNSTVKEPFAMDLQPNTLLNPHHAWLAGWLKAY